MDYENKTLHGSEYELKNSYENFEMAAYTVICFFVPLLLGHPQIVVGIAVNAILILAALNIRGYRLLPVIISPALGALSQGLLFGPFTIYLLYLVPFIWIGNAILVYAFKELKVAKKKNYFVTLLIGAIAKSLFLFLAAFVLYSFGLIPAIFLTAMGILQFTTAIGGGIAAYGAHSLKKRLIS